MFCRHAYNCIMPARKKSRRGHNLQKLNCAYTHRISSKVKVRVPSCFALTDRSLATHQ